MSGNLLGKMAAKCPHCGNHVTVPVYAHIGNLETERASPPASTKDEALFASLGTDEQDLARSLEADGIIAAYVAAYKEQSDGQAPANPLHAMWGFFTRAATIRLPDPAAKHYRTTYRAQPIEALTYNGIVAIFSRGELKEFVPVRVIQEKRIPKAGVTMRVPATVADVERWTKTKFGYVASGGAFNQMMRRRSVGAFADV